MEVLGVLLAVAAHGQGCWYPAALLTSSHLIAPGMESLHQFANSASYLGVVTQSLAASS